MNTRKFDIDMYVPVYGGLQHVYIDSVSKVNNIEGLYMDEIVGFVKIVYPFGGANCHLQLELYKQEIECRDHIIVPEKFTYDLSFKIPFAIEKSFYVELLIEEKYRKDYSAKNRRSK